MAIFRTNNTPPGKAPPPPAPRPQGVRSDNRERLAAIYDRVQRRLLSELSPTVRADNAEEVRRALSRIYEDVLAEEDIPLSRSERTELFESIVAGILGYGPLEPYLQGRLGHRNPGQRAEQRLCRAQRAGWRPRMFTSATPRS